MKNRCKFELIVSILDSANDTNGVYKTYIMYKTFLNPRMINRYLPLLIKNNLIEYQENEKVYRITEKVIYFLRIYNQFKEMISIK